MSDERRRHKEGYVYTGNTGNYRVIREIGHGGMSTVYLVSDVDTNRIWALKEYDSEKTSVISRNIIMEAWALKKLRHRAIPYMIDVFESDGNPVIVMEYVSGRTLAEILKETGKLKSDRVRYYMCQVCEVLSYLHELNPPIIYRDIKPSNIIVRDNGEIALIDFGTIREYKPGLMKDERALGTKEYASPEQRGRLKRQTDPRSDIYAVGVTLFQVLTGKDPRGIRNEKLMQSVHSEGMQKIIRKCIRVNPSERFRSARELHEMIANYRLYDNRSIRKSKLKVGTFIALLFSAIALCITGVVMGNEVLTIIIAALIVLAATIVIYFVFSIRKELSTLKKDKALRAPVRNKDENLDATELLMDVEDLNTESFEEYERMENEFRESKASGKKADMQITRKQVNSYVTNPEDH